MRTVRLCPLTFLVVIGCGVGSDADANGSVMDALEVRLSVAREVYASGAFDEARTLFRDLEGAAAAEARRRIQAIAMTSTALASYNLGDYADARTAGERSVAFKHEHDLRDLLSRSYNALGLLAWQESRFSDALALFDSTTTSASAVGDVLAAGVASGNRALVQTELGRFDAARRNLRRQMAAGRDASSDTDPVQARRAQIAVGNAYTNLGMLAIRVGDPTTALPLLDSAIALHVATGAPREEMGALGHLGTAYTQLGQLGRALEVLDSALTMAIAQDNRQEVASLQEAAAEVYLGSGDFRRTLERYEEARIINEELGLVLEAAIDVRAQATIRARQGDLEHASELAGLARASHTEIGAPVEQMRDLLLLAEIEARRGSETESSSHVAEARALAEALDGRIWDLELAMTEARIADHQDRPEVVLRALEALDDLVVQSGYDVEWQARLLTSKAYARIGRWGLALIDAVSAWSAVERTRSQIEPGALRAAFGSDKHEVYAHLVRLLLREGRQEDALTVADQARSRVVGSRITERRSSERPVPVEFSSQARIGRILETIAYLEEIPSADRYASETDALGFLYDQIASIRAETSGGSPESAATGVSVEGTLPDSPVPAARGALRPGQVVLEYFIPTDGTIRIFALTAERLRVLESPLLGTDLYGRVRLIRDLLGAAGGAGRAEGALTALYDGLVGPAEDAGLLNGVDEVITIPHGILAYVPFAALVHPETGRYLVQDVDVRVMPSLSAIVADIAASDDGDAARRPDGTAGFAPMVDDLSFTEAEIAALRGPAPIARFAGSDATETRLRSALETNQVVHVATHGVLNAHNPLYSRLEMTPDSDRGGHDGRLEVHEVLDLDIRAHLVFLSGCETAVGPAATTGFERGEDFSTLSHAFLHAGAQNVIATLWRIEDEGAARFAEAFFTEMAQPGTSPTQALARAQRVFIAEESDRGPYYWAAYQITGWTPPMRTDVAGHP